jgi:hypothetical protein
MRDYREESRARTSGVCMLNDVVYMLWHTDAYGDEKLIGVYRTEEDALAAVERIKPKPGFSKAGGKFECTKYELNKDHWTEGFGRPVS